MRFLPVLFTVVVFACGGIGQHGTGTRTRSLATVPSGKRLAIYTSPSFSTEARAVPEDVLVQAMRASSMFFEEDIRALSKEVSETLGELGDQERIVVETEDTSIHVFVAKATGELQLVGFRGNHEISRHASAIPAAAVKTELTVQGRPVEQPQPAAKVEAPPPAPVVATPAPAPVAATPIAPPTPKAKSPAKPKAKPAAPKLSESELRAKLDELERLHAKQLITDAEYDKKRKALLDQL